MLVGVFVEGSAVGAPSHPPGAAYKAGPLVPIGPNLVVNPTMSAPRLATLASGLTAWGASPYLSLVRVTVGAKADAHLVQAEEVELGRNRTGGVWFTVPVSARHGYLARFVVIVRRLDSHSGVSLNLEWYRLRSDGRLPVPLGAVTHLVRREAAKPVVITEGGSAPATANSARVVVNVAGGGEVLFVTASLRAARHRGVRSAH